MSGERSTVHVHVMKLLGFRFGSVEMMCFFLFVLHTERCCFGILFCTLAVCTLGTIYSKLGRGLSKGLVVRGGGGAEKSCAGRTEGVRVYFLCHEQMLFVRC